MPAADMGRRCSTHDHRAGDGTIASRAAIGATGAALWGKPAAQRTALPSAGCAGHQRQHRGSITSALLQSPVLARRRS